RLKGRNGGHLTPSPFLEFYDLHKTYGVSEAIKTFEFERRAVQTLLRFVEENRIAQDIDLVAGGHITLFVTDVEEEVARRDFEAAIEAGLVLNAIEWIEKDDMLKCPVISATEHTIRESDSQLTIYGLSSSLRTYFKPPKTLLTFTCTHLLQLRRYPEIKEAGVGILSKRIVAQFMRTTSSTLPM
ncbi:hypothetical protein MPER_16212, partial [Moniliophthora perniciosa FA553]